MERLHQPLGFLARIGRLLGRLFSPPALPRVESAEKRLPPPSQPEEERALFMRRLIDGLSRGGRL